MSILIDQTTRVLVQGITGREGQARARLMMNYGTQVVAGVTPSKGGQIVEDVPVFDGVQEAWERVGPIDASAIFVPAPLVKNAALEAIEAGVKLLLLVPDRVPIYDVLEIVNFARSKGARFIGPNTLGILSPGKAVLGMIGGRAASAKDWFLPGPVGIISRSGGITSSMAYYLGKAGIGATTLVHVGGDVVVGLPQPEVAKLFQADPETQAIVIFGEIGGSQEEQVAELIASGAVTKPVIAFIGGKAAKSGTRFSHAGAIVEGNRGTHAGKVKCLREAGATVVDAFGELPAVTQAVLTEHGIAYGAPQ
ncbi:MAG: CoA-binding protein [Anaerolineales bacterium]|nr:CoA-binding protein [Anaerolineales bacterium]